MSANSPGAALTLEEARSRSSQLRRVTPKQILEVARLAKCLAQAASSLNPTILPHELHELQDTMRNRLSCFGEALAEVVGPDCAGWPSSLIAQCVGYAHHALLPRIAAWACADPIEIGKGKGERFVTELSQLSATLHAEIDRLNRPGNLPTEPQVASSEHLPAAAATPTPTAAPAPPRTMLLDDAFCELRDFARAELKGKERAVIEALCASNGELPIANLAIKPGVDWNDPIQGFKDVQRRLKTKLKKHCWKLQREDNAAKLKALKRG